MAKENLTPEDITLIKGCIKVEVANASRAYNTHTNKGDSELAAHFQGRQRRLEALAFKLG